MIWKALLLILACSRVDRITPYKTMHNDVLVYGFTVDYSDGSYGFYDIAVSEVDSGTVIETIQFPDFTGEITVLSDSDRIVIAEAPADLMSGDKVNITYSDGQPYSVTLE